MAITSLQTAVEASFHAPFFRVYIAGRPVDHLVYDLSTDHGYDTVSAAATVSLTEQPTWLKLRQPVEIALGYNTFSAPVFSGFIESIERSYFPATCTLRCAGWLKLSQYKHSSSIAYTSQTDQFIVGDLLDEAGISERDIQGSGQTFGTVDDVELRDGEATWELINKLDQTTGYKTFDSPDGKVRRRRITGIPTATPAYGYTQGDNIIAISRPYTIQGVHNRVVVTGRPGELFTPSATRQATSPWVPTPPTYVTYEFSSELIEDNTYAEDVATRLMSEVNRVVDEITITIEGDPRLRPGQTVALDAPAVGVPADSRYWIRHVSHTMSGDGFETRIVVEGGSGDTGYAVGEDPEAEFSYRVDRETGQVFSGGYGASTEFWFVNCDGTGSFDPDGVIVAWAWTNNKNADTSAVATYATRFTSAEIATATVTLTVTDDSGATAAITQNIEAPISTTVVRDLYVAAGSRAEASRNGGATWNTWTPPGGTNVVSTPEIAGLTFTYFGCENGKLYWTNTYLAATPIEIHDFSSAIRSIWINENDNNRVWCGLANGHIYLTTDANLGAASTWTLKATYSDPILRIIESAFNLGEVRICTGREVRITYTEFSNYAALITFPDGATARHTAGSLGLSGYACATITSGTNAVQTEAGVSITGAGIDVRAITHHIGDDKLFVVNAAGQCYVKLPGATTFTALGAVNASGTYNHMIRDGVMPDTMYLVGDEGAFKTYDGGNTWLRLRDYTAAGLTGHQIGYGGTGPLQVAPACVYSTVGTTKSLSLWNGASNDAPPDDWVTPGFDDSGWSNAVLVTDSFAGLPGAAKVWPASSPASTTAEAVFRHTFSLPAGEVTSATFMFRANDVQRGAWINGTFVGMNVWEYDGYGPTDNIGPDLVVQIPAALLLPGQNNVIAVHGKNGDPAGSPTTTGAWVAFSLCYNQFVLISQAGQGKCRSLWNGASNDSPPANWETTGYDDSSWVVTERASQFPTHPVLPGTEPVWSSFLPLAVGDGTADSGEACLFRHEFYLPMASAADARLVFRADEIQHAAYLNGNSLGSETTAGFFTLPNGSEGDLGPDMIVSVSTGFLVFGGRNVLALWVKSNSGQEGVGDAWASYRLEITG